MFKKVLFSTAVILVLFAHFYSKGYFKICFNFILIKSYEFGNLINLF